VHFAAVMALISSASSGQSQSARLDPAAQKKGANVKAAQALAKQKSLEKKAKTYKLPMGELAIFTQQIASLLRPVCRWCSVSKRCRTRRKIRASGS
jgi:hypothetical protein